MESTVEQINVCFYIALYLVYTVARFEIAYNIDQYFLGTLLNFSKSVPITNNYILHQGTCDEESCYGDFGTYLVQPYIYGILGLIIVFRTKHYFVNFFLIG